MSGKEESASKRAAVAASSIGRRALKVMRALRTVENVGKKTRKTKIIADTYLQWLFQDVYARKMLQPTDEHDVLCDTTHMEVETMKLTTDKGTYQLPNDLDRLVADATPAPFGKGAETVHDPAVRRASKHTLLDVEAFQTDNKYRSLKYTLNDIATRMVSDDPQTCAYDDLVKVKPQSVQIYTEGGHFDWHRDTKYAATQIATIVVVLPFGDTYSGGVLECRGTNIKNELVTEEAIPDAASTPQADKCARAAIFLCSTEHRVTPVTKGMRISLQFAVHLKTRMPELIADNDTIDDALARYLCTCYAGKGILLPCDTMYTRSDQVLTSLRDAATYDVFTERGCRVMLVHISAEKRKDDDNFAVEHVLIASSLPKTHKNTPVYTVAAVSKNEIERDGHCCVKRRVLLDERLLDEPVAINGTEWFSGITVKEESGGYTGNESAPAEYEYCCSGMLVLPPARADADQ